MAYGSFLLKIHGKLCLLGNGTTLVQKYNIYQHCQIKLLTRCPQLTGKQGKKNYKSYNGTLSGQNSVTNIKKKSSLQQSNFLSEVPALRLATAAKEAC